MINKITISNIASFGDEPVVIDELKKVNYFFGNNGSGKTTISRLFTQKDASNIEWDKSPIDCFVYNSDFKENNITEEGMKGIFTLGKENKDIGEQIINLNKIIVASEEELKNLRYILGGKFSDNKNGFCNRLDSLKLNYQNKFWIFKKKHLDNFLSALEGYNGSKIKFFDKILDEDKINRSEIKKVTYLEEKVRNLYSKTLVQIDEFQLKEPVLEEEELTTFLQTVIVGRNDLPISKLWRKFNFLLKFLESFGLSKICLCC